jgi:hypothetical protein
MAVIDKGTQQVVARAIRVGSAETLEDALKSAGVKITSPKPKPKPKVEEQTECPRGGEHSWVSDGEGGRYCENCYDPHPSNPPVRKSSPATDAKHLEGMCKTVDVLRKKCDDLKKTFCNGDPLWQNALDGLDNARKAFAKLARKAGS